MLLGRVGGRDVSNSEGKQKPKNKIYLQHQWYWNKEYKKFQGNILYEKPSHSSKPSK